MTQQVSRFLDDYHETLIGMRTGQANRAAAHFSRLVGDLLERIQRALPETLSRAAPVFQEILEAQERRDLTTQADLLQYQIPQVLDGFEIGESLFEPQVFSRLQNMEHLLAEGKGVMLIERELETMYRTDDTLNGLSAYFAGRLYEQKRYGDARSLLEVDGQQNRKSAWSTFLLALVLGRMGEFAGAESLMACAYAQSPVLQDGFATLGRFKAEGEDWEGGLGWVKLESAERKAAVSLMEKDYGTGRLSPNGTKSLAYVYGALNKMERAEELIGKLYSENAAVRDFYTALGFNLYVLNGDKSVFFPLYHKDLKLERHSLKALKFLAWGQAIHCDWQEAVECMRSFYEKASLAMDGFAILGWIMAEQEDREKGIYLMREDYARNRISSTWLFSLAYLLTKNGELKEAREIFERACYIENSPNMIKIGFNIKPKLIVSRNMFKKLYLKY